MSFPFDLIIAGAGLAGASAALALASDYRIGLVEARHPAAGASGAAAGLVNPLMARKARLVWKFGEAREALMTLLNEAEASTLYRPTGILRPARDERQAQFFKDSAHQHPDLATWWSPEVVEDRFSDIDAPYGALNVFAGGCIDVPGMVNAFVRAAVSRGVTLRTGTSLRGWYIDGELLRVELESGETLYTRRLLLTLGYGYSTFSRLQPLNLHPIKGQAVRVRRPALTGPLPCVSGRGYIVPETETLVLGSTYEHAFSTTMPTPDQIALVLDKAAQMIPALHDARVLEAFAGVRVTVPGTRLPMVGPVPGEERVWVFTGLGSKGVLMAPLVALRLGEYLRHPDRIDPVIASRNYS